MVLIKTREHLDMVVFKVVFLKGSDRDVVYKIGHESPAFIHDVIARQIKLIQR